MRALLGLLLACTAAPALADECGDLVDRVAAETPAEVGERSADYANFRVGADTTLTLACGGSYASSVGAQFRGDAPPDAYYAVFGRAGHAVTGIAASVIEEAAHRTQATATRLRHSNIDVGKALVTCSAMASDKGPLTLCAVIERSERS